MIKRLVNVFLSFIMMLFGCGPAGKIQRVEISNGLVNTFVIGNGSKTIVMLSGCATENPIEDFMPLARKLSKNFKVVVIEYFGYGASDIVFNERSSENIVGEIRETLAKLKIKPPYILMPHSISGIYSRKYAKEYPNEVEAIIGIDTSKPNAQKEFYESNERLIKYFSEDFFPKISDKGKITVPIFNEANMFYKNSEEFFDVKYPENLPVLSFISSESIKSTKLEKSLINLNKITD